MVLGKVFCWLQRVVVSLAELFGDKVLGSVQTAIDGEASQVLEVYRQMVKEDRMPCMIPAGYFKVLMDKLQQRHGRTQALGSA